MGSYSIPITYAFIFFPFLAFLITLPYILYQYHKYGSIPFLRSLIVYSFILYLTNIFFLVILPLPSREYVNTLTTPYAQLLPFNFIGDIFKMSNGNINMSIFFQQAFEQVFFNLVMFIPLGIYLRYYFKCSLKKTLLISFLVSLFFELTQLSGLYGFYARPYRLFDIDDLMFNTLGGAIGYFITYFILKFMPSRDDLDNRAYQLANNVTFGRRFVAFCINWLIIGAINGVLSLLLLFFHNIEWILAIVPFTYFIILTYVKKGQNIGYQFVNIKLVTNDGKKPKFYQYIIRYFTLYTLLFLPITCLGINFNISFLNADVTLMIEWFLRISIVLIYFLFLMSLLLSVFQKNKIYLHDKLSKTKVINTITNINEVKRKDKVTCKGKCKNVRENLHFFYDKA